MLCPLIAKTNPLRDCNIGFCREIRKIILKLSEEKTYLGLWPLIGRFSSIYSARIANCRNLEKSKGQIEPMVSLYEFAELSVSLVSYLK